MVVDASKQGGARDTAPFEMLPAASQSDGAETEVNIHAIVDHSIIEVIVNNRTAFTFYTKPTAASAQFAGLYGMSAGNNVTGTLDMWKLKDANNIAPPPPPAP